MAEKTIADALVLIGIPVGRSILGWAENALADKEISPLEWAQLGETVVRVGTIGIGIYFGLDFSALAAGMSAVVLDFVLNAIKKAGTKK